MTSKRRAAGLNLKLHAGIDARRFLDALQKSEGVLRIVQTFPDEPDDDLAKLYLVEAEEAWLKSLLDRLRADPAVEYVEKTVLRKLIR